MTSSTEGMNRMAFSSVDRLGRSLLRQEHGRIDDSLHTSHSRFWRERRHLKLFDRSDVRFRLNRSLRHPDLRPDDQEYGSSPVVHFSLRRVAFYRITGPSGSEGPFFLYSRHQNSNEER